MADDWTVPGATPVDDWSTTPMAPAKPLGAKMAAGPVKTIETSDNGDVIKALLSGVVEGVHAIPGIAGDSELLVRTIGRSINGALRKWYKLPEEKLNPIDPLFPTTQEYEKMTGFEPYKPKTTAGQFASTIGSFLPTAALPGAAMVRSGIGAVAKEAGKSALKYGVVPAVASESAGELTKGTALEPYARIAGAVIGGGGVGLASRIRGSKGILERQVKDIAPDQWNAAEALQQSGNDVKVPLTATESLSGAGASTNLPAMQRMMEQTETGAPIFGDFFNKRPEQIERAGQAAIDRISPVNTEPSQIGPAVQEAADAALKRARQGINRVEAPHYQAAESDVIPTSAARRLIKLPGFKSTRRAVREDPFIGGSLKGKGARSVGVLGEVKKALDRFGSKSIYDSPVEAGRTKFASATRDTLKTELENASPEYKEALRVGEEGRTRILDPMQNAPIGKLADTADLSTQAGIVFKPLAGGSGEVRTALRKIMVKDPKAARDLAATHLRDVFAQATKENMGGANQWGGAKFNAMMRGNGEHGQALETVVRTVAGNDAWDGWKKLLDVFQATGKRLPANSATEANRLITEGLKAGKPVGELLSTAASPTKLFGLAAKIYQGWRGGKNIEQIAKILVSPNGVKMLREIARARAPVARALRAGAVIANSIDQGTFDQRFDPNGEEKPAKGKSLDDWWSEMNVPKVALPAMP